MDKRKTCGQDDNTFRGIREFMNARLHLWKVINIIDWREVAAYVPQMFENIPSQHC